MEEQNGYKHEPRKMTGNPIGSINHSKDRPKSKANVGKGMCDQWAPMEPSICSSLSSTVQLMSA